jgi:RND family efflux transporter MFP subunit
MLYFLRPAMPLHPLALLALLLLSLSSARAAEPLATAVAEYRELPREYRLDGMVEAVNQTTVSAQTQGQVSEVLFDVNDLVEKGSVIVRLKDTEQKARLSQAEADFQGANARLQEAQEDYKRIKEVFAKKAVSQSEMDTATAVLKEASARRDAAAAGLVQAQEQFEYTLVRAPYSGIVTHRQVEPGSMATPGQPLMSGISLDELRVVVQVPQSLIPAVREHNQARVQQPGNGWFDATKITIFPFAQHGSNTFVVRLNLPEGLPGFVPGMFVKSAFTVGSRKVLLIPERAVAYRSEMTGVYVVGADERLTLRQIRLGARGDAGMIEVLAGLDEGEQVALDPVGAGVELKAQGKESGHE